MKFGLVHSKTMAIYLNTLGYVKATNTRDRKGKRTRSQPTAGLHAVPDEAMSNPLTPRLCNSN